MCACAELDARVARQHDELETARSTIATHTTRNQHLKARVDDLAQALHLMTDKTAATEQTCAAAQALAASVTASLDARTDELQCTSQALGAAQDTQHALETDLAHVREENTDIMKVSCMTSLENSFCLDCDDVDFDDDGGAGLGPQE